MQRMIVAKRRKGPDESLNPLRWVIGVVSINPGCRRVLLECGHEVISKGEEQARCVRCGDALAKERNRQPR